MQHIFLGIMGASGKMGRMLIEAAEKHKEVFTVRAAFDVENSPWQGKSLNALLGVESTVNIEKNLASTAEKLNCVIDFTRPEGTLKHLEICENKKIPMVIGTTGLDEKGKGFIKEVAQTIPIVFSPNMSVGVNVVFKLLEVASQVLNSGFDVEIVEAHHRLKADSPSGTALKMGEIVANAFNRDLKQCAIYGREGVLGVRKDETIAFSTIRGGDIVGDHTVMFCGIGERVEITHKGSSRMTYAEGALRAAAFLQSQKKGLFDMQDVLGLRK